jgi:hypothetical protein
MDNIIEKVKKLLTMAERGTEHEAAIAAAKAQTLLMQHNIDLSQIDTRSEVNEQVCEWLLEAMSRRQIWKGNLANAIAEANFCRMWWLGSDIKLVGKEHNVQIGRHLYDYLVEAVERVTKAALAAERQQRQDALHLFNHRAWANSFRLGCAHRLCDRLQEQKLRLETEGLPEASVSALTCVEAYQQESEAIAQWMRERNVQLGSKVRSQARTSRSGYQAGKAAGGSISLNHQMSGNYSNRLLRG